VGNYRELKVWQKGRDLAIRVYQLTSAGEFQKDFGLRDQIRRAAVSIASNIAEGDELDTDNQSGRHFFIAKGSVAEVCTQAEIACAIGYLSPSDFQALEAECGSLAGMLTRLIQSRRNGKKPS